MNKKLIAMAVAAGFAAPMPVMAAPTVYGQMQVEISSEGCDLEVNNSCTGTTTDGQVIQGGGGRFQKDVGVADNKRGRLGVKGSEDLGGGLKAIYKFEWQINTTDGNPNDGARESMIGLKGGFGQFEVGRLKSSYKYYGGVKYDPFVATELEARRYGGMTTGAFGSNSFLSNTVAYQNKFGMASFRITYNPDEQAGTDGDYTLGLKFGNKKWEAGFAVAHDEDQANVVNNTNKLSYDAAKVFGKVKFGKIGIRGQYESTSFEFANGDEDGTIIFLGVDFKVGAKTTLVAQIADNTVEFGNLVDQDGTYYALGVIHKFSKKTRVFGGYGKMEVDNADNVQGVNNGRDVISVGLRVDF